MGEPAGRTPPPGNPTHGPGVVVAVAVGGVLGAWARYGLALALPAQPDQWPTATLLTNAAGCLLIGVLMVVLTEVALPHRLVRPFLAVGVLGGFTTFSTYGVEVVLLHESGRTALALGYLALTPVAALAAVAAGVTATRALAGRNRNRRLPGRGADGP